MNDYEDKLKRELEWHTGQGFRAKHFLNRSVFFSPERNAFNYVFPRKRLALMMDRAIAGAGMKAPAMLVAPLGTGEDMIYISHITPDISGIDISEDAVRAVSAPNLKKFTGDVKDMSMFPDESFDIVVASLFFHHFVNYGFEPYLNEMNRVLKPGGYLFSLEPSSLNPFVWAMRLAKMFFGNITGTVEDEAPFYPPRLAAAMGKCGFDGVRIEGAGFAHNRTPIFASKILNAATLPLLRSPVVKHFCWMCVFQGIKKSPEIN
ncbi:MAG: class I SAM-dependent methyltransferase [bacterium]